MNWGVKVSENKETQEILIRKGRKSIGFKLSLFGKDVFKRDIKRAKIML